METNKRKPKILVLDIEHTSNGDLVHYECGRCPPTSDPQPTSSVSYSLLTDKIQTKSVLAGYDNTEYLESVS